MINQINKTIQFLNKGGTILYPTDTVWGIGCDATNEKAVKKIYEIKQRNQSKSLIVLVDSFMMLQKYVVNVPQMVKDYLSNISEPITVIYKNPIGLAKNTIASDDTIAIRIVKEGFCNKLITKFEKPIVSTSANISGFKTPIKYNEIDEFIISKVDFIVGLDVEFTSKNTSKIIKFINDEIIILRD